MSVKRASYSADFKLQVIQHATSVSQADASRKFNINKSQISRWVKNADLISQANPLHKRLKGHENPIGASARTSTKRYVIESEDDTVFDSFEEDCSEYVRNLTLKCPESPDISAYCRPSSPNLKELKETRNIRIHSIAAMLNPVIDDDECFSAVKVADTENRVSEANQGRENAKRLMSFLQAN